MRGTSLTFEKRCHDYRQIPMDLLTGTGIESSNLARTALIKALIKGRILGTRLLRENPSRGQVLQASAPIARPRARSSAACRGTSSHARCFRRQGRNPRGRGRIPRERTPRAPAASQVPPSTPYGGRKRSRRARERGHLFIGRELFRLARSFGSCLVSPTTTISRP